MITASEPERILNYCSQNGIDFWDASPKSDYCVCFSVSASDYPRIIEQNGKNGCEIRLISSKGGKNIAKAVKRRYALCIGFGLCVILLAISSLFIWQIDIIGNSAVSDGEIYRALEQQGVHSGTFWPKINTDEVKNAVLSSIKDIAWLSVNVSNSRVEIIVHERIKKPEIINSNQYAEINAKRSGIITNISVLEGTAVKAVGDTVLKGDMLISGVMDSQTGDKRLVHAMGTVEARTWYEMSAQCPLYETVKTEKKSTKTKYSLVIGKKRLKILSDSRNISAGCDKINKLRYLGVNGAFTLPVGILKLQCTEYETEIKAVDEAEAVARMKRTLLSQLEQSISDGTVSEKNFTVSKDENCLSVTLRAECVENIGAEND